MALPYCYRTLAGGLRGRSFLTIQNYTPHEITFLIDLSRRLKQRKEQARNLGVQGNLLAGLNIVLIFDKVSTRTRCSFEIAVNDEGGGVTFLSGSHMGEKESVEDTAIVLGKMYDGIEFRGFAHEDVERIADHAKVPVWNGLTNLHHPTQALADFMTAAEYIDKPFDELKVVFVGDAANNVAYSLMITAAKLGAKFVCLCPVNRRPMQDIVRMVRETYGGVVECYEIDGRKEALAGADMVYTDVWVSMGDEHEMEERIRQMGPYRVDMSMMMDTQNENCKFFHCLPAFHNLQTSVARNIFENHGLDATECTDEVFRSERSVVFEQAANRVHTIKAVMVATVGHLLRRAPDSLDQLAITG